MNNSSNTELGVALGVVSLALHVIHAILKFVNHSHVRSECCGSKADLDLRMDDESLRLQAPFQSEV